MNRTLSWFAAAVAVLVITLKSGVTGGQTPAFRLVEATIPEMQAAIAARKLTSRELVSQYLMRIALYESRLHAVLAVNGRALEEADALDRERAQGKVRGPL